MASLKNSKIARDETINLLLLGETGAGKSTFINSFVNYIRFSTLEEARASSDVSCIIPTKFNIPDDNLETRTICFGEDDNEDRTLGHSSTQEAKSHVFPHTYNDKTIRIIDTPGIGDARGLKQDEINVENILNYISRFDMIHAICFILKPNVSVITLYFKFCIKHLLSRLNRTATDNIVFIFTNSRSTFYRPAETMTILKVIFKEIETGPTKVIIPCNKNNIFCMDNEAFKFLIALKNGFDFGEKEFEAFSASWNKSVEACNQLLAYVAGDDNNVGLVPHPIQNIISINEARRIIIDLSKPMADISQMVNDNLTVLGRHKKEIEENTSTIEELKAKLYIPAIDIIEKKLSRPVTVCTAAKCSEKYTIDGITKYHYKQRCHNPCYLTNVPEKIIGSPALLGCAAMSGKVECMICKCNYQIHMHILYETELKSVKIIDDTVTKKIENKKDLVKGKEDIIISLNKRIEKFKYEQKIITKYTAQFAHFLKENSITPYNDAYGDYLSDLIQNEKNLGDFQNSEVIKSYKDMLNQYKEEKKILDKAMNDEQKCHVNLNTIFDMQETLYKLPICGDKLKSLHESQQKGKIIEYKLSSEKVYSNIQKKPQKQLLNKYAIK